MSNHSFNEAVVPTLRPDPARPGATVDADETSVTAIDPNRGTPETGFDLGARAGGSAELREMLDRSHHARRHRR